MDSTQRFSNRVEDYVKYRPGYPTEVITYLQEQCGLTPGTAIADIGAGTGISTALFLQAGYEVYAVEPNEPMLNKARELLNHYPAFHAVPGTAENTTLPAASVAAIIAGQAFHWFNTEVCKIEFKRILNKEGLVVLMWNERKMNSPFEKEYDQLIIQHARDYVQVDHRQIDLESITAFFAPLPVQWRQFPNQQLFDFNGLKGRLSSSSYMPAPGEPAYEPMINDLQLLFHRYQQNNTIRISYDTNVYVGKMN
jgi:ubiquinone/menaquinone biosynthesis C-methylase UbiE